MSNDGVAPLRVAEAKKFVAISRARFSPIGAATDERAKAARAKVNKILFMVGFSVKYPIPIHKKILY